MQNYSSEFQLRLEGFYHLASRQQWNRGIRRLKEHMPFPRMATKMETEDKWMIHSYAMGLALKSLKLVTLFI